MPAQGPTAEQGCNPTSYSTHLACCKGASAGSHSPRLLPCRAEVNATPPPATSSRCAPTSCSAPPMLRATEVPLAGGHDQIKAACHRGASPWSYGKVLLHSSTQSPPVLFCIRPQRSGLLPVQPARISGNPTHTLRPLPATKVPLAGGHGEVQAYLLPRCLQLRHPLSRPTCPKVPPQSPAGCQTVPPIVICIFSGTAVTMLPPYPSTPPRQTVFQ